MNTLFDTPLNPHFHTFLRKELLHKKTGSNLEGFAPIVVGTEKNGLTTAPKDWEYLSFHRYVYDGMYDLDWGA